MSMNLSNIAVLNIKGSEYSCIISLISKNEALILLQNAGLTKKAELYEVKTQKFFESIYKNGKNNYNTL